MRAISAVISATLFSPLLFSQAPPELTYQASGTVENFSTGAGIAGALVVIEGSPIPNSTSTAFPIRLVTGPSGSFSIKIPPTTFLNVNVSRGGYQSTSRRFINQSDAKDLRIKLAPYSAIEGRVLNSDGEPVPGMNVQLLRSMIHDGRRHIEAQNGELTNDLGEFRLWDLTAGDYYVRLSGRYTGLVSMGPIPGIVDPREAYPTVFYPAAPDIASAQIIHLTPGQTARADFRANPRASYSIRGRLTGIKLHPGTGMRLRVGDTAVTSQADVDPASGNFTVIALLPGTYTLQAVSPGEAIGFGEANVVVSDHDVTGLVIPMSTGVTIQGRVQYVGSPEGKRNPITIVAEFWDPSREVVPRFHPPLQTNPDGSFLLDNMQPGRYRLQVQGLVRQYIESIRSGTTDVLADGLTVGTAGSDELTIVLREGGATIHGTVTGSPKGGFPLVVIIPQPGSVTSGARSIGAMEEKFTVTDLPPGKYSLYAWPITRQVEYMNPEALRAAGAVGVTVNLTEGTQQEVTVPSLAGEE